jgi:predicted PurR-regulated permease PerM
VNSTYLASGPLVWIATIGITTLLLVASAKALFLVVPFLLAIILYYILYPVVRRLELGGISRETGAALVAGGVTLLAVAVMIPTLPWLVGQSISGEAALGRYLEGGRVLIDRTLEGLESEFGFLKRMDFRAEVGSKVDAFGRTFMQEQLPQALLQAAMQLPSVLLAPFLAFFLLRDGRRFLRMIASTVPNAFFERTVFMFDRVHQTTRNYFQGLLKLAVVDAALYTFGLWLIGVSGAAILGVVAALLAWIPLVGSALGCIMIVLAAATEFPSDPWAVYAAVGMFLCVRFLDTFVIMPLTVGRSIRMHPLPTVLMLLIGGTVAGVPGLVLALPMAGVVSTVVGTIGAIIEDPRLHARHRFAKSLMAKRLNADLRL